MLAPISPPSKARRSSSACGDEGSLSRPSSRHVISWQTSSAAEATQDDQWQQSRNSTCQQAISVKQCCRKRALMLAARLRGPGCGLSGAAGDGGQAGAGLLARAPAGRATHAVWRWAGTASELPSTALLSASWPSRLSLPLMMPPPLSAPKEKTGEHPRHLNAAAAKEKHAPLPAGLRPHW